MRAGLASILEEDDAVSVVAEAATADALLARSAATRPDVVVVDIDLPGLDVRRDVARLVAPVVLMGSGEDEDQVWSALSAGVRGFVDRGQNAQDFRAAVHAVASGQAVFPPSMVARLLDAALGGGGFQLSLAAPLGALTRREREVLMQMAQGRGNTEISDHLVIQPSTVKSHVTSILRKLDVTDRTQAVILAIRSDPLSALPPPATTSTESTASTTLRERGA